MTPDWTSWWLERGYARDPCRESCPYRDEDHAHLRTPDGGDVMLWPDGSYSNFDLSQPARLIYPCYAIGRALRDMEREERDRHDWINGLRRRWGLVTIDGLPPARDGGCR